MAKNSITNFDDMIDRLHAAVDDQIEAELDKPTDDQMFANLDRSRRDLWKRSWDKLNGKSPSLSLPMAASSRAPIIQNNPNSSKPISLGKIWIDDSLYGLSLSQTSRKVLIEVAGEMPRAVLLAGARYELSASTVPSLYELVGMTHGDVPEILEAHFEQRSSGRFER